MISFTDEMWYLMGALVVGIVIFALAFDFYFDVVRKRKDYWCHYNACLCIVLIGNISTLWKLKSKEIKTMAVYIHKAAYPEKCAACSSTDETIRIKFLRPKSEHVVYFCSKCYNELKIAMWVGLIKVRGVDRQHLYFVEAWGSNLIIRIECWGYR